jgi:outer membrane protein assembly factor BamB
MDAGPYNAPSLQWSFASSPVLHGGRVVVQCDVLSTQFVAAFDAASGRELWRTPRQEVATWCTPAIAPAPGLTQIVCNGWKHIAAYDLATGAELWRLREGGDIPVASPIVAHDLAFLTSAHGKYRPMRAVRLTARGDITPPEITATNAAVVWCHPRQGNYLQTPIVVGDLLWGCLDNGVLSCFDARSGRLHYSERLGNGSQGFTASPVAANGHLYFTGEQGDVFVLPATTNLAVLATNRLGDLCLATPAISDGTLFFRTREKLLAIGSPAAARE